MAQVFQFQAMGGPCEVHLELPAALVDSAQRLGELAVAEARRIETKFSRYQPGSWLSQVNAGAGHTWVTADVETLGLLDYAAQLFESSEGLFDITSGVLRKAWNFKTGHYPSDAELAPLLPLIGFEGVERKDAQVRLARPGMELDFGGIGKEYAVDRVAALLRQAGVSSGMVNFAGDIQVLGPKPDGQAWLMAVQHPRDPQRRVAYLPVMQGAMTTSGDYERAFEHQGLRHCHILNPRTGRSVRHWQSVTVQAPLASAAGACCTIAMLKQEQTIEFLDTTGCPYLAIDAKGAVWTHETHHAPHDGGTHAPS